MILSSILIRNFRAITEVSLRFNPGMQLFLGCNAQGKTSLVEAILFLSTSTSHRTRREEELIRWNQDTAYLRGEVESEEETIPIECGLEKRKKTIKIDGNPLPRIGDLYGHLRTVLFAPEDLAIIGGSPQDRRRFLDMSISQMDPSYIRLLQQYRRALKQRNHLLKRLQIGRNSSLEKELAVWEQPFLDFAVQVIQERVKTVNHLSPFAADHYAGLADDGPLALSYPAYDTDEAERIRENLNEKLERLRASEIDRGASLAGPHRDDILFTLDGKNLGPFGSQGQRRTAALALRLSEAALCRERVGHWPLLLIDDVLHEMDNIRRAHFWDRIDPSGQSIVTATGREHLGAGFDPAQIFKVDNGSISLDRT